MTFSGSTKYLTKNDARKAEVQKLREIENQIGKTSVVVEVPLLDLINERLDYLKLIKTEKYYDESRYYLNILFEHFGNVNVYDITKGDIQKVLLEQTKKLRKNKKDNYSANAMLRAYKALFFYGIKYLNISMINPCIGIAFFPIKSKLKYIPSDEEIKYILDKCNKEQKLLVEFVRDTGCRISEALYMRQRDVFDEYVALYTRKSKSGNLMPRKVKYDSTKLLLFNKPDERVFSTWNKTPKFLEEKIRDNNMENGTGII